MEQKVKIATAKESKIKGLLNRIEGIYESFQCNLTCFVCGEISQNCTLCIPCGHCFCGKCLVGKYDKCPNCSQGIEETFESKALEEIACKFSYSKKMVDLFKDDTYWNL